MILSTSGRYGELDSVARTALVTACVKAGDVFRAKAALRRLRELAILMNKRMYVRIVCASQCSVAFEGDCVSGRGAADANGADKLVCAVGSAVELRSGGLRRVRAVLLRGTAGGRRAAEAELAGNRAGVGGAVQGRPAGERCAVCLTEEAEDGAGSGSS